MTHLQFRRCTDRDREHLHALRNHVEDWLANRGLEQHGDEHWSNRAHLAIDRLLDTGRFVALCSDDWPVAVAALSAPDMDFWTDDDNLPAGLYIARMMSGDHGNGYGAQLLDTIAVIAAAEGREYLRLDCMRENTALHDYYRRNGFELLRTVERDDRESGALFQRRVANMVPKPWDLSALPGITQTASRG